MKGNRSKGRKNNNSKGRIPTRTFTNTVRVQISGQRPDDITTTAAFGQIRLAGPLSDADGTPMAYRPPQLLSKVNPTNFKISSRSPFQKRPLDSESTTAVVEFSLYSGTQKEEKKTFSLAQLLDLNSRQVIFNSVGIQALFDGQPNLPNVNNSDQYLLVITTIVTLLPQTKFDFIN